MPKPYAVMAYGSAASRVAASTGSAGDAMRGRSGCSAAAWSTARAAEYGVRCDDAAAAAASTGVSSPDGAPGVRAAASAAAAALALLCDRSS